MTTGTANYTVQDFIAALERNEIIVNRDYQRSDDVSPDAARSYLIETVLLDYPIPKLAVHQVTDPSTGRSHKELVDGQQRAATIRAFHDGKFESRRTPGGDGLIAIVAYYQEISHADSRLMDCCTDEHPIRFGF